MSEILLVPWYLYDWCHVRRRLILHRNRISSLKVFHFLLYRRLSILRDIYFLCRIGRFVSELIDDARIHTRKLRASKFPSLPKSKNVMNMARHFNNRRKYTRQAHHKTHLHTIRSGTSWFLSPVFTVSASNAREHGPLMARTHEKKKKKEQKNDCIFRVCLIKQERLITIPYLGVHALDFSSQNNCMRHS